MIKKQLKPSLADKIAGVLSAVPTQFDPDDDCIDDTKAKLTEIEDFDEDDDDDETLLSKFRKQNVELLADVDTRYAGKKGSRKSLKDEESEVDEEDEDDDDTKEADEQSNEESEEESDDGDEEESEDGSNSENEGSISLSDAQDDSFQHMKQTNVSQQVKKGLCIRNQMNIWENLLEMRIQMQKCLVAANKMPQKPSYKEMLESGEYKSKITETKDGLSKALNKLLDLQKLVVKKYPETKKLLKGELVKPDEGSDEEIPSDTDEEVPLDEESEEETEEPKAKRRKLTDFEQDICDVHDKYKGYRNDTIVKWDTKTRLSVSRNKGQAHSVVSQIEHILSDKDKLRKKSQLKKSEFRILGQDEDTGNVLESNEDIGDVKQPEEYNAEIFDDSDFYHQLLRELIESKSSDISDPVQLSRQWIKLQNLRSKMKRKIDTRATKGRKIRYAVHTKLVNFMAPYDQQLWTEEAKNELYSSLFGKV